MGYRNRYTHGVKTLTEIDSITDTLAGDTVFCTDNNRKMTYDGDVWLCSDFIKLKNNSGLSVTRGNVVVIDTTQQLSVSASATLAYPLPAGVVQFGGSNGDWVSIAYKGMYPVQIEDSTGIGDYLAVGTTAFSGSSVTTQGVGRFGIATEAGTANTMVKFILHTKPEFF